MENITCIWSNFSF